MIVFEAPADGLYEIYYMPFVLRGDWWSPSTEYLPADAVKASDDWKAAASFADIPDAAVLRYESRTAFDSFYPMEFPMTAAERAAFTGGSPFMAVPESRLRPIRMQYELPAVWLDTPASSLRTLRDTACANEHYVFQIAVIAGTDLHDIRVAFRDAHGRTLPRGTAVCFNLQGRDAEGREFTVCRDAVKGQVLSLWCGLRLEDPALSGKESLRITAEVTAKDADASETADIALTITPDLVPNNGDDDLWRMSRLFWLNAAIGIGDDPIAPYEPIENGSDGRSMDFMGKRLTVGPLGLPASFTSRYDHAAELADTATEILASPVELIAEKTGPAAETDRDISLRRQIRNAVTTVMEAEAVRCDIRIQSRAEYEADGHIDCRMTLTALAEGEYAFTLRVPVAEHAAESFMGLSYEGGRVPAQWEYRWDPKYVGNHAWVGGVRGGIQLKLMPEEEFWGKSTCFESLWKNGGKGKMRVRKTPDAVLLEGITGSIRMRAGQTEVLHFHMITTPFHPIDKDRHWHEHIYHTDGWGEERVPDLDYAKKHGATIINLHQGGMLNENINYPFRVAPKLKEHVRKAHETGMRYKLYYTVRELSDYCAEIWAFRSLGGEIYTEDSRAAAIAGLILDPSQKAELPAWDTVRRGGPWLNEHLTEGFVGAWHQFLFDGEQDCAVHTKPFSRLLNYYLCGLDWMIREVGIDGVYLDGIGYDRRIMKRVRRIMQHSGKRCDIDIHCGNDHEMPCYGYVSPANLYLEHFAYADSLWNGEGYHYEDVSPEYYLTEISGIPFGLMGEMLHGGGNPWRGMVYGMTARMGWQQGGISWQIWKLWEEFGISSAKMLGWWDPACPVSAENDLVRVTAYVKENGDVLIAAASWCPADRSFLFSVNKEQLGIEGDYEFYAPFVEDVQEEATFASDALIPIAAGKGWLFILRRK